MQVVKLCVNGQPVALEMDNHRLLVELLRGPLGLAGTHVGCDTSRCGACTVPVDGQPAKSCTLLALQAEGCEVTTIDGLARGGRLHPVQQAFVDCHGLQCGYCTPGMALAAVALLQRHPLPGPAQIEQGLDGNLCRCTGYVNIIAAVQQAARTAAGGSA